MKSVETIRCDYPELMGDATRAARMIVRSKPTAHRSTATERGWLTRQSASHYQRSSARHHPTMKTRCLDSSVDGRTAAAQAYGSLTVKAAIVETCANRSGRIEGSGRLWFPAQSHPGSNRRRRRGRLCGARLPVARFGQPALIRRWSPYCRSCPGARSAQTSEHSRQGPATTTRRRLE